MKLWCPISLFIHENNEFVYSYRHIGKSVNKNYFPLIGISSPKLHIAPLNNNNVT